MVQEGSKFLPPELILSKMSKGSKHIEKNKISVARMEKITSELLDRGVIKLEE